MKRSIATGLFVLGLAAAVGAQQAKAPKPVPWQGYNQGVKWEASLDEALKRAARENKPVLLYQLVGDLDKEGC
jgi:ABC-type sugar transport system substrate-binding protein